MSRTTVQPKKVGETRTYQIDFTSQLVGAQTVSTCVATAVVYSGTDGTPSAIISGSATVNSFQQVSQKLTGGVAGVIYEVTYTATLSDSTTVRISFYLAVLPN